MASMSNPVQMLLTAEKKAAVIVSDSRARKYMPKNLQQIHNTVKLVFIFCWVHGSLSECTKFVLPRGSAPDPAGEAYDAPQTP